MIFVKIMEHAMMVLPVTRASVVFTILVIAVKVSHFIFFFLHFIVPYNILGVIFEFSIFLHFPGLA